MTSPQARPGRRFLALSVAATVATATLAIGAVAAPAVAEDTAGGIMLPNPTGATLGQPHDHGGHDHGHSGHSDGSDDHDGGASGTATPVDPSSLGENELVDLDGTVKKLSGRVTFTNPRVTYIPNDPVNGPMLKIAYTVSNESNAWASDVGTANWADKDKGWYANSENGPMTFACTNFVPFAPKGHAEHVVSECIQTRLVTDEELAAGKSLPDSPYYTILYGQDYQTGLWADSPAEAYPSVPVEAPLGWRGRDHFVPADDGHGHHHHHGHDHDHAHDHDHGHDHGTSPADDHDHAHTHDGGHDHGNAPTNMPADRPAEQPKDDESSPTALIQGAFKALMDLFALISGGFGVFFTQLAGLSS